MTTKSLRSMATALVFAMLFTIFSSVQAEAQVQMIPRAPVLGLSFWSSFSHFFTNSWHGILKFTRSCHTVTYKANDGTIKSYGTCG